MAFVPSILLVSLFLHDKYAGLSVLEDLKIAFRQLLLFEKTEAAVVGGAIPIAWALNRTTSIFRGNVPRLCGSFWY